jgi:hypothetical protein
MFIVNNFTFLCRLKIWISPWLLHLELSPKAPWVLMHLLVTYYVNVIPNQHQQLMLDLSLELKARQSFIKYMNSNILTRYELST